MCIYIFIFIFSSLKERQRVCWIGDIVVIILETFCSIWQKICSGLEKLKHTHTCKCTKIQNQNPLPLAAVCHVCMYVCMYVCMGTSMYTSTVMLYNSLQIRAFRFAEESLSTVGESVVLNSTNLRARMPGFKSSSTSSSEISIWISRMSKAADPSQQAPTSPTELSREQLCQEQKSEGRAPLLSLSWRQDIHHLLP